MLRFLAFVWHPAAVDSATEARRLVRALQARPGWQRAASAPGLEVHVCGHRPASSGWHLVGERGGVIVGTLFRRTSGVAAVPVQLGREEAQHLLAQRGSPLVTQYWGRYVAFLPQGLDGDFDVLRDPGGSLPCYRLLHDGIWLLCSWLEDALMLLPPTRHPRPERDGVLACLQLGAPTGPRTALSDVWHMLPGERLSIRHDRVFSEDLWCPAEHAAAPWSMDDDEAARLLASTVRDCTRQWAACHERIVLRLSGGVDSSILATCLHAADTPAQVLCLNHRSTDPAADERSYARLAADAASRPLREVAADAGVRWEELLALARTPAPPSHLDALGLGTLDAATAEAFGASAIFSGVGGDLLFFELHRAWPAADYLLTRGIDRGFLPAVIDAARLGGLSVWEVLRLSARACRERHEDPAAVDAASPLLAAAARLDRQDLMPYQHPAFHQRDGLPPGKRVQLQQLLYPVACYPANGLQPGPEPVRPLLSQPLVELALAIPTYVLTRGGQGRALARRAFADALPPAIAARSTKGTTGQAVADVLARHRSALRSLLLDGELARLKLIDRSRVDLAASGRATARETPAADLLALVAAEAWLRSWSNGSTVEPATPSPA